MKKILIQLLILTALFGFSCQQQQAITILDPETYEQAIMADDVQLVDVRTPEEYQDGYIKDAENIDFFDQDTFKTSFDKFDKDKPIYLYCRSGGRSQKAAAILSEMGFKEIYDLEGGYLNWK